MQHRSRFARRLCVAVDTEGYGSKDNVAQYDVQTLLREVLDEAANAAGLDRTAWARQQQGDGELSLLPPDQPEPRVIDDFIHELAAVLQLRNHGRDITSRMRLRVSLDFGVAYEAAFGFAGSAVVATARLLGSDALHVALAGQSNAVVAVALSPTVYQTVLDRHTSLTTDDFVKVQVSEKEYSGDAWIRTLPRSAPPRANPETERKRSPGSGPRPPQAQPHRSPRPAATTPYSVHNDFHDHVDAGVIGINISAPDDLP